MPTKDEPELVALLGYGLEEDAMALQFTYREPAQDEASAEERQTPAFVLFADEARELDGAPTDG